MSFEAEVSTHLLHPIGLIEVKLTNGEVVRETNETRLLPRNIRVNFQSRSSGISGRGRL